MRRREALVPARSRGKFRLKVPAWRARMSAVPDASEKRSPPPSPNRALRFSGDHLILVDGSGFIFRAYHALPPLTRKSDGLPVGAVLRLLQHAVEAAVDMKARRTRRPTWR